MANTTTTQSVGAYFRAMFKKKPELVHVRSNDDVLEQWLKDHPSYKDVPANIRQQASNIKSYLRKIATPEMTSPSSAPSTEIPRKKLEHLEEKIDLCISEARGLSSEAMDEVIVHLRSARNTLIHQIGTES